MRCTTDGMGPEFVHAEAAEFAAVEGGNGVGEEDERFGGLESDVSNGLEGLA